MKKEITCPACMEGKILPAIPIPGKEFDDYPDCPHCFGTGKVIIDPLWIEKGNRFRKLRIDAGISLRKFCFVYNLDPIFVSRVERGLVECPDDIELVYWAYDEN